MSEAQKFLEQLLKIPSVNGVSNEKEIAKFIYDVFVSEGIDAEFQEIDDTHGNVCAVLEGRTKEYIIWNGHIDTVPCGNLELWETDPFLPVEKDGKLYARGTSDMKSGLAGMVWTLIQMKRSGYIPKQTIYFYGTCDEEKGGLGAKYLIEHKELGEPTLLLIGEPTGNKIGVAQKGCIWLELELFGKTSHGAYPKEGVNVFEYGICIYEYLKRKIESFSHIYLGNSTIQITMMDGGIVPNMTPDKGNMMFDIRVVPQITLSNIIEWLDEIVKQCREETRGVFDVKYEVKNNRKAIEIAENNPWLKCLEQELSERNMSAEKIGIHYFTDASVLTKNNETMPVLLFGPGEETMAHKPNEYVKLENYFNYIDVLRKIF